MKKSVILLGIAIIALTLQKNKLMAAPQVRSPIIFYADLGSQTIIAYSQIAVSNYNEGLSLLTTGLYDKAIEQFDRAISKDSAYIEAYIARGQARNEKGMFGFSWQDYEMAISDFNKASNLLKIKGKNLSDQLYYETDIYISIARALMEKGSESDRNRALLELDKALRILNSHSSEFSELKKREICLEVGIYHFKQFLSYKQDEYLEKSQPFFNCLMDNVPSKANLASWARFYYYRGEFYKAKKEYSKVIEDYGRAIKANVNYQEFLSKENLYWKANLEKKVKEQAVQGGEKEISLGISSLKAEKYSEAIDYFSQVINKYPNNNIPWYYRGVSYNSIGQYQNAINDLTKAINLSPNEIGAWQERARAYDKLGNTQKSLYDYTQCTKLSNDLWNYYNRGNLYKRIGRCKEANEDFRVACTSDHVCMNIIFWCGESDSVVLCK